MRLHANPYSYSTSDSVACKRMICGRLQDVQKILRLLTGGHSIALFGEKRIGKTLTLYIVRDFLNGTLFSYHHELIDKELSEWILEQSSVPPNPDLSHNSTYISLQEMPNNAYELIGAISSKLLGPGVPRSITLPQLFAHSTFRNKRYVILIDEIEHLLRPDFSGADLVFGQFRSAIEQCPDVNFVFAGQDNWVREVTTGTSPISGNCHQVFLCAPRATSLRKYLLDAPLRNTVQDSQERQGIVSRIMEETGGKPFYCQIIAFEIAEGQSELDAFSKASDRTKELESFFKDPPHPGAEILAFLAYCPGTQTRRLVSVIGADSHEIRKALHELESLGKISQIGGKYHINGALFQRWGQQYLPRPILVRRQRHFVRPIVTFALVLLLAFTYFYSHPLAHEMRSDGSDLSMVVSLPGSVEANESGQGYMYLIANSVPVTYTSVFATDDTLQLNPIEGSSWHFENLRGGQVSNRVAFQYQVASTGGILNVVRASILLSSGERFTYEIPLRSVPIQRYWTYLGSLVAALLALLNWSLLKEILSFMSALQSRGK